VHTERTGRQENRRDSALNAQADNQKAMRAQSSTQDQMRATTQEVRGRISESKGWQYMDWHIINHKDYIDGPFDSFEAALAEACSLGNETRPEPRVKRRSDQFFVYRAPYDREEKWRPEFWICTKEGALRLGVAEELFNQPLLEMAVGASSFDSMRFRANGD
jgi:hypothetical protein